MFDLVQGAEVNDHEVDQLEDEGNHCVGNGQPVVEVEVAVVWITLFVVKSVSEVGGLRGSNSDGHSYGELQNEVEGG